MATLMRWTSSNKNFSLVHHAPKKLIIGEILFRCGLVE